MNILTIMDAIILSLIGVIAVIFMFMSREFRWLVIFLGLCFVANRLTLIISLPIVFFSNFFSLVPKYRVVNENHVRQPFTREIFGEITAFSLFLTVVIFILAKATPLIMTDSLISKICEIIPLNACSIVLGY